jgi:DNA-directed RNA polymerase III subunit RPC3
MVGHAQFLLYSYQQAVSLTFFETNQSHCEQLAEHAMVPAKDTREILHRLYRDNYIELFNINLGKQHNPASMIYLWGFSSQKCHRKISDNVCTALYNIRLRRQHEVEVGKDFIERAKDAGASDENENEADKKEYTEFCRGLERLDNALIMLDETLMVLKDF